MAKTEGWQTAFHIEVLCSGDYPTLCQILVSLLTPLSGFEGEGKGRRMKTDTYRKVAIAVIEPPAHRVDQPRRVESPHHLAEPCLGPRRGPELTPSFVEDDPRNDGRMALVVVDHGLELPLELGLLPRVGRSPLRVVR